MPQQGRLIPNEAGRTRFSLRGKVIQQLTISKGLCIFGWWLWGGVTHAVGVQLYPDQLKEVRERFGEWVSTPNDSFWMRFPEKVAYRMPEEKCNTFAIGEEVVVTFGLSGVIDQFFTGTTPLEVLGMVKTTEVEVIENEILPVQLHLV